MISKSFYCFLIWACLHVQGNSLEFGASFDGVADEGQGTQVIGLLTGDIILSIGEKKVISAATASQAHALYWGKSVAVVLRRNGELVNGLVELPRVRLHFGDVPGVVAVYNELFAAQHPKEFNEVVSSAFSAFIEGRNRKAERLVKKVEKSSERNLLVNWLLSEFYYKKGVYHKSSKYLSSANDGLGVLAGRNGSEMLKHLVYSSQLKNMVRTGNDTGAMRLIDKIAHTSVYVELSLAKAESLIGIDAKDRRQIQVSLLYFLINMNPFRADDIKRLKAMDTDEIIKNKIEQLEMQLASSGAQAAAPDALTELITAYEAGEIDAKKIIAFVQKGKTTQIEKLASFDSLTTQFIAKQPALAWPFLEQSFYLMPDKERAQQLIDLSQKIKDRPRAIKFLYGYCSRFDDQIRSIRPVFLAWKNAYKNYYRDTARPLLKKALDMAAKGNVTQAAEMLYDKAEESGLIDLRISAGLLLRHHKKLSDKLRHHYFYETQMFWRDMLPDSSELWWDTFDYIHVIARTNWRRGYNQHYRRHTGRSINDGAVLATCAALHDNDQEHKETKRLLEAAVKYINKHPNHYSTNWMPCIIDGELCENEDQYIQLLIKRTGINVTPIKRAEKKKEEEPKEDALDDF